MTHKSDVLSCLEILAENEARDAGTPETAYQLFERKRERYRVDQTRPVDPKNVRNGVVM